MADFKTAYTKYIQPSEGGYANVSKDKGGETYAGISRIYNPTWKGWVTIDSKKNRYKNGIIPHNTLFADLQFLVDQFYQSKWDSNRMGEIKNQDIANLLFDFYINSDKVAFKKIQLLVGVTDDGIIGPKTLAAINNADQAKLYKDLLKVRNDFYDAIVKRDPSQSKFIDGWKARLAKFPQFISNNALPIAGIIGMLLLVGAVWYFTHATPGKKKTMSTAS
jgi:lysozyme family protein